MAQVEKSILRGLIRPHERMEWWDDESGEYTSGGTRVAALPSGGPLPGIPDPLVETEMVLQAAGTQSARGALDLVCQRGGFPDRDRASFLWKEGSAPTDEWYGWDAPTVLVGWEAIDWTASAGSSNLHPHAVTLPDGKVVCVVEQGTSSPGIIAYIRDPDTGTWSDSEVWAGATQTQDLHPCLCFLPSGRLLCFAWVNDETEDKANVRMWYSDDDGTTWSVGQYAVLPDFLPTSTATGAGSDNYSTRRLRAAYSNGQILLLAGVLSMDTTAASHGWRDAIYQYASLDLGASFTLVTATESVDSVVVGAAFQDIVVLDGRFVIAYLEADDPVPYVRIIGSAYEPWTNATAVGACPGAEPWGLLGTRLYSDGDLALFRDEGGNLYVTGRQVTINHIWTTSASRDSGETWEPLAKSSASSGSGKWWDAQDGGTYPADACATWQRGRALVIHSHESTPGIYDESLSCSYLGGYSTVTMPGYEDFRELKLQVTWGTTYLPFDEPDDMGWTQGSTGTVTDSISSGRLVLTAASFGDEIYYYRTPTGSVDNGILVVFDATRSGPTAPRVIIRTSDGAVGYGIEISFLTALTVEDLVSGASIENGVFSTIAEDEVIQFLAAIKGNDCVVYARRVGTQGDDTRTWTLVASSTSLTNDGGATFTTSRIQFGAYQGFSTGYATFGLVAYVDDEGSATNYVGSNIVSQTNPDDLLGRPFSSSGTYISDGVTIKAVDGPAFHGDAWNVDVRYQHPVEHLLPTITPSPRQVWRSAPIADLDVTTDFLHLAWRLDGDGAGGFLGAECYPGNDLWGVLLDGMNCAGVSLDVYYGSAWHTVASTGVQVWAATRRGNTLVPTTSSTLGAKYRYDEMKGCGIGFYSGGYSTTDWTGVIRGNTEGITNTSGVTSKMPVFHLEEADGGSSSSPSVGIWPRRHLVTINASGFSASIQGVRLRIPVNGTAYPGDPSVGYYEMSKFIFGPMLVFGHDYSWQRNISVEANTEITTARDGRRSTRVLGPARTTLEVGWSGGVDVSDFRSATAPDYVKASANSGSLPVSFYRDTPILLQDWLRAADGADSMIVYVPNVAYDSSSGSSGDKTVTSTNRAGGAIYGRVVGPVRIEQVLGEDESSEVYRVTTIPIESEE